MSRVMDSPNRQTFTVAEVADRLGISTGLAYRQVRETGSVEGIPAIKIGKRIVFSRQQVERRLAGEPVYQTRAS